MAATVDPARRGAEHAEPAWVPDVRHARTLLIEALLCDERHERYRQAHRAAVLAAAAAVLGRTGRRPGAGAGGVPEFWALVARTVPALGEWAAYFTAVGRRCERLGPGRPLVSEREADDLVREADLFCEAVVECLRRDGRGQALPACRSAG